MHLVIVLDYVIFVLQDKSCVYWMTIRATYRGWPGILWGNILLLSAVTGTNQNTYVMLRHCQWDPSRLIYKTLLFFMSSSDWCVFIVLTPRRRLSASVKWALGHLQMERSVYISIIFECLRCDNGKTIWFFSMNSAVFAFYINIFWCWQIFFLQCLNLRKFNYLISWVRHLNTEHLFCRWNNTECSTMTVWGHSFDVFHSHRMALFCLPQVQPQYEQTSVDARTLPGN